MEILNKTKDINTVLFYIHETVMHRRGEKKSAITCGCGRRQTSKLEEKQIQTNISPPEIRTNGRKTRMKRKTDPAGLQENQLFPTFVRF